MPSGTLTDADDPSRDVGLVTERLDGEADLVGSCPPNLLARPATPRRVSASGSGADPLLLFGGLIPGDRVGEGEREM